ncbi:MAG: DUF305 domain-containing protein [Acidimicrobiales bacterium]
MRGDREGKPGATNTDAGITTGAVTTAVERGGRFRLAPPSRGQLGGMVLALLFLAGCVGYVVGKGSPPGRTSVDVGFLRDMIDHHDQAVVMANVALDGATEPLVRHFAREVLIAQRYEVGLMDAWLGRWGYGGDADRAAAMGWMGVPTPVGEMPGMASPTQMEALRQAQGRQVDALFLAMMKEHHRGGIEMASVAARTAEDRDVRALAARIARYQRIEINEMESARQRLGLPTG